MDDKNYKVPGHLQSRCRRCKKTYHSYTKVANIEEALMSMSFIGRAATTEDKYIMEKSVHECSDGGLGLGDCVGGLTDADMVPEKMELG